MSCPKQGYFEVGQFNAVIKIYLLPTLVVMATTGPIAFDDIYNNNASVHNDSKIITILAITTLVKAFALC